jgi:GT2 family glycosyltransferase
MAGTWTTQQVAKLYRAWAGDRPHARPRGPVFDLLSTTWRTGRQLARRVKQSIQSIQFELEEPMKLTGCGSLAGRVISQRRSVVHVEAFAGGVSLGSAVPDSLGRFRLCPMPGCIPDGQHAMQIIAHTASGRVAVMTTSLEVDRFTMADSTDLPMRLSGSDREYQYWLKRHDVHDIQPCEDVCILVQANDDAGAASVTRQTHRNWRWVADDVAGELVISVPAGHELHPQALAALARQHRSKPASRYYFDDDVKDTDGVRHSPRFKPGCPPIQCGNVARGEEAKNCACCSYLGGVIARQTTTRPVGLPPIISHIPGIFVHRNANDSSNGCYCDRSASSRMHVEPQYQPVVSILIPSKDQPALLRRCISSLRRLTTYPSYEIIVIDNGSTTSAMARYLAEGHADRVLRVEEPFNHSRLNNLAAALATGELLLLLNDDTEVLDGQWLAAMVRHMQEPETGAVGAWLDFPDGTVQHAGIVLETEGIAYNLGSELLEGGGQYELLHHPRVVSAVTGACLLVRKDRYLDLGGLDEALFPTSYNDVDFCLRLAEQGYRSIVEPSARLLHHESASRRCGEREATYRQRMHERWGKRLSQEQYRNPWLSQASDRARGLVYHWA